MFLKVYCSSDITVGDVLHYNPTSQLWEKATGIDHPLCVASEDAALRNADTNDYAVKAHLCGACTRQSVTLYSNVQGGELTSGERCGLC